MDTTVIEETEQQERVARRRDERGEGVISAAIAVLVMAFLGVAMWVSFNVMFRDAASNASAQVRCIGGQTTCDAGR